MRDLLTLLLNPNVLLAVLGLFGSVVGFLLKQWIAANDAKVKAQQQEQTESELANALAKKSADQVAQVNDSIRAQNQAADDWAKKGD